LATKLDLVGGLMVGAKADLRDCLMQPKNYTKYENTRTHKHKNFD
jgi:hypothetical protein